MDWRSFLWPFSLLYGGITAIRNLAFNNGVLKSKSFKLPVIGVGNLSTGGTGKTPMVEFILNKLIAKNPGVVSRGYGRKTKGLILAQKNSTSEEIGDEPFQIHRKFPNLPMALSEKRVIGIEALLKNEKTEFVLLDDAYQHRYVNPSYQVLLSTFSKPFYNDLILPAGNLRESTRGKKRANCIIITKCPEDLSIEKAHTIESKIKPLNHQKVFFSSIKYGEAINHEKEPLVADSNVILISGIANPTPFIHFATQHFQIQTEQHFPDHHHFTEAEIKNWITQLNQNPDFKILTTEKDWVRLLGALDNEILSRVYYIPIHLQILFNKEAEFVQEIEQHISSFSKPSH